MPIVVNYDPSAALLTELAHRAGLGKKALTEREQSRADRAMALQESEFAYRQEADAARLAAASEAERNRFMMQGIEMDAARKRGMHSGTDPLADPIAERQARYREEAAGAEDYHRERFLRQEEADQALRRDRERAEIERGNAAFSADLELAQAGPTLYQQSKAKILTDSNLAPEEKEEALRQLEENRTLENRAKASGDDRPKPTPQEEFAAQTVTDEHGARYSKDRNGAWRKIADAPKPEGGTTRTARPELSDAKIGAEISRMMKVRERQGITTRPTIAERRRMEAEAVRNLQDEAASIGSVRGALTGEGFQAMGLGAVDAGDPESVLSLVRPEQLDILENVAVRELRQSGISEPTPDQVDARMAELAMKHGLVDAPGAGMPMPTPMEEQAGAGFDAGFENLPELTQTQARRILADARPEQVEAVKAEIVESLARRGVEMNAVEIDTLAAEQLAMQGADPGAPEAEGGPLPEVGWWVDREAGKLEAIRAGQREQGIGQAEFGPRPGETGARRAELEDKSRRTVRNMLTRILSGARLEDLVREMPDDPPGFEPKRGMTAQEREAARLAQWKRILEAEIGGAR